MELTPREKDKLLIFTAVLLAEHRKARGLKLNSPKAGVAVAPARHRHVGHHLHPGPWHIEQMLRAVDAFPMNQGFLGKGNASLPTALRQHSHAAVAALPSHVR